MKVNCGGISIHIASGGRDFVTGQKTIVMLHGSGQSHLTWVQQSRYFAFEGYNVIAPDLPVHGLSGGAPLQTIEEMSDFMHALLGQLGCGPVVFIGHSQGCLIGLDMCARYQADLERLVLIAGGLSIPVNDYLVGASQNKLDKAIEMMTGWGHSNIAHMHDNELPGHSHLGFGRALMASNDVNALHADLSACNAYDGGAAAAAAIKVPTLVILAAADKMTPAKAGRAMAAAIAGAELIEVSGAGHMLPAEKPLQINNHITRFLSA